MSKVILYACSGRSFFSRNIGRKIPSIVQCWERMNYKVHLLCGGDIDGVPQDIEGYLAKEYHDKWFRKAKILRPIVNSISERRDIFHDLKMRAALSEMTREISPDIIWERSCRLHCAGLEIARENGIPYVLEWKDHLIPYSFSRFHSAAVAMETRKNAEADFIVVESEIIRDNLGLEGVDKDKILVAQNAVDVNEFNRNEKAGSKIRAEMGVADDEILAGYLGSYAFYHDTRRLVLAADILRKQKMEKIKILMIGRGEEFPESHRLAEKLGLLDANLIMRPTVPLQQVAGILSALDIAVLPGSTEIICPIKIQEYMASGLPTAAPDYECNREVIDDGKTGVLFTPKNEQELAKAISSLAEDRDMRMKMGQEARDEVEHRFTWEKTWGAALDDICQKVMRQSDRRRS